MKKFLCVIIDLILLLQVVCLFAGEEFRFNSHTDLNQAWCSIGMNGESKFVITWQSEYQDLFVSGVFAQRFEILKNSDIGLFLMITNIQDRII